MEKTIIMILSAIYYKKDGYRMRVDMEIEILKSMFNIVLLIPHHPLENNDFPNDIVIVKYDTDYSKNGHLFINYFSFNRKLDELIKKYPNCIIYGESLIPTFKSIKTVKKNKKNVIFDCHGTEPNEFKLNIGGLKGNILKFILIGIEKIVLNNCVVVITVTNAQFNMWNSHKENFVLPMLPTDNFITDENKRNFMRKSLCIRENEEVYVYSGQNQKWQMCEETISIYKKISEQRNNTRLIIYTKEIEYFKNLCKLNKINDAIVMSVAHTEMPQYLDVCDYGFCIRNDSVINKVASPTKVLEYLSRNVKPILSSSVGDYSKDFVDNGLAIIWKGDVDYRDTISSNGEEYVKDLCAKKKMLFKKVIYSLFDNNN